MKAHGVGERNTKHTIVGGDYLFQSSCQLRNLVAFQLRQARQMPPAAQQHFERPHSPERHDRDEAVIAADHTSAFLVFDFDVIAKKATAVYLQILLLGDEFA